MAVKLSKKQSRSADKGSNPVCSEKRVVQAAEQKAGVRAQERHAAVRKAVERADKQSVAECSES